MMLVLLSTWDFNITANVNVEIPAQNQSDINSFQSAKAFMRGMFPDVENFTKDFEVSEDNDLLRVMQISLLEYSNNIILQFYL